MKKYLLSILAVGAIASVSQAQTLTPIALELWTFDDAEGLSFHGTQESAAAGFANTGSIGSKWNFGSFGTPPGALTDANGNLVFTGFPGQTDGDGNLITPPNFQVSRKTSPSYSPARTTGVYRLTLDIASWETLTAGGIQIEASGGAGTQNDRIAMMKFENHSADGPRIQATIRNGTNENTGGPAWFYRKFLLTGEDLDPAVVGPTIPLSAYVEFDLDANTGALYVNGANVGGTASDLISADLTMLKVSQDSNYVDTNNVKVDSMGLYLMADLVSDTDGDGINDYYETGTGTWVSTTDTGTDPTVADTNVASLDIALYNYIASLDSSTGSAGPAGPEGPQGPPGPAGPAGADGLDSSAIQSLRSSAHIERSPGDATFNVNYSIESSSDLENWTPEVSNSVSVDPTSSDKLFLRLSTN